MSKNRAHIARKKQVEKRVKNWSSSKRIIEQEVNEESSKKSAKSLARSKQEVSKKLSEKRARGEQIKSERKIVLEASKE